MIIRNPAISLLAARDLLLLSEGADHNLHDLVQRFRDGSVLDLECLAQSITVTVTISDYKTPPMSEDEIFKYFVEHGATRQMVRDLVRPIGSAGLSRIRNKLGISHAKPKGISQDEALMILDAWRDIDAAPVVMAEKLVSLHKKFTDISLASLYALVNEC